jgi:hypothetical protein
MTPCVSKDGRAGTGRDGANVLGVRFDFTDYADVVKTICLWRACGERRYISITNPHSVMVCRRDRDMGRATAGAALTVPDGVGVIWAARILGYRHPVLKPARRRRRPRPQFAAGSFPRSLAGAGPSPSLLFTHIGHWPFERWFFSERVAIVQRICALQVAFS